MFILNYVKNFLQGYGFFQKSGKVLFLGLANAGKTSLMGLLKTGVFKQYDPTLGVYNEEIVVGNMKLKAFDLGGHEAVRKAWKNYYAQITAIFYLVDSSSYDTFEASKYELQKIIETPELQNIPIAVLGNKIDLYNAVSGHKLGQELGLFDKNEPDNGIEELIINSHPIKIFMCSLSKNVGFKESFTWISQFVK